MDSAESAVLLSGFARQLRRKKAIVPDINFFLPYAAGIVSVVLLNQVDKAEKKISWSLSKSQLQKLRGMYTKDAAFGNVRSL